MQIQRTSQLPRPAVKSPAQANKSGKAKEIAKKVVTTSAFAAGGTLGGATLGSIGGHLLSTATGQPGLSSLGTVAGGVLGATTGVAASLSDDKKQALISSALTYSLGTAGATAGLYGLEAAHQALVAAGATPLLGDSLRLSGAIVGGLAGAGIGMKGQDGIAAAGVKKLGAAAALGTAGLGLGMAASLVAPGTYAPYVFGATGALIGNAAVTDGVSEKHADFSTKLSHQAIGASLGFAVGEGFSLAAQSMGGSSLYGVVAPAAGALMGGLLGPSEDSDVANTLLNTAAVTSVGAVAGDLAGHGLAAVTGNSMYSAFGAAAGAATGFVAATPKVKEALPIVGGTVAGTAAGALAGTLLSSLTGNEFLQNATPILGAATGFLTGAALKLNK